MASSPLRILHISDIHFGRYHIFNSNNGLPKAATTTLLKSIFFDAENLNTKPDIVIICGDLTSEGSDEEFDEALQFLIELQSYFQLDVTNFIIIPGNHDVFRGKSPGKASRSPYEGMASKFYNVAVNEVSLRSIRVGDVYVLGLDSTILEPIQQNGIGLVGRNQLDDAVRRLTTEASDAPIKLLAIHHHLLPVAWVEALNGKSGSSIALDSVSILTWAQEQGFTGLLHGHQHRPFFATIHLADQKGGPLFIAGSPSAASNDRPPQTRNGYLWLLVDGSRIVISTRLLTDSYRFEDYKDVEFIRESSGTFSSTAIPSARPSREPSTMERRTITKTAAEVVLNAISPTYGPAGGIRGLIRIGGVGHVRDGFQILHSIHTSDPVERRIIEVFSKLAEEVTKRTGDGRKTAAIICAETLKKALNYVEEGIIEKHLADGIMEGVRLASRYIKEFAKFPGTKEEAGLISATTSAYGFPEIASTVQDAVEKAGQCGKIVIERGDPDEEVQFKLISIPPFTFPLPHMPRWLDTIVFSKQSYVINKPAIIIYNGKISAFNEILPLLKYAAKFKRPLIFVCQKMEHAAAEAVERNTEENIIAAVPAMYETHRQQILTDIALITQARYLSESKGDRLSYLPIDLLGFCEKVTINVDGITFHNPPIKQEILGNYLKQLKNQLKNTNDVSDRQLFEDRLACMSNGRLKIIFNGRSEQEGEILHSLIQDALKASQAAIQDGLVPGAGSAYVLAANYIRQAGSSEQIKQGIDAFATGLEAPLKVIVETNNNSDTIKIIEALIGSKNQYFNGTQIAPWEGDVPSEPSSTTASVITLAGEAAARILKTVSWEQSHISEK